MIGVTMNKLIRNFITKFILVVFCFSIVPFTSNSADLNAATKKKTSKKYKKSKKSKKKRTKSRRSYNPSLTRAQALSTLRSNSEELCSLAGLEPYKNNVTEVDANDSEDLTNENDYDKGEDITELEAEDDVTVDIETFKTLWLNYIDGYDDEGFTTGGLSKKEIMDAIMDWIGTPYHFGGTSRRGIDCSAFVQAVFSKSCQIQLPRIARNQYKAGYHIKMKNLEFGDLIFFHTYSYAFPSHVGIYLGDDLFAHASSRFGVTISSLKSTYYNNRFIAGTRLVNKEDDQYGDNNEEETEEDN